MNQLKYMAMRQTTNVISDTPKNPICDKRHNAANVISVKHNKSSNVIWDKHHTATNIICSKHN